MIKKAGSALMNPKTLTAGIWVALLGVLVPAAVTSLISLGDTMEQKRMQERVAMERIAMAEASMLHQEGEITPKSIAAHLEPILNGPLHDYPMWAKLVDYTFGEPKVWCLLLNDVYRDVYSITHDCFGKTDTQIYSERTGIVDPDRVLEGVQRYREFDLYVASQADGFCAEASEPVLPWWVTALIGVEVTKCHYVFGSFDVVLGVVPSQEDRPDRPAHPIYGPSATNDGVLYVKHGKRVIQTVRL